MAEVDEQILRRLDLIQTTLALAFAPQLNAARDALRADAVTAATLAHASEWVVSTELQQRVAKATNHTTRTVRNRLPELVSQRVLEVRGPEKRLEYRRSGLV